MKILIFGGNGMLGHKLVQVLHEQIEVWATIRGAFSDIEHYRVFEKERTVENVEVTDLESVVAAIEKSRPDVVINAVGVIKQLPDSKNVITTLSINSIFPQQLANLSEKYGYRLITIGTDCVFSGTKGNYTETDMADAVDLYGQSKRWGEVYGKNCLTLRTSIIGHELGTAHSLLEWFLSNRGGKVKGFSHAIYSGFPTVVFADIIRHLIVSQPSLNGLFHVSSEPISKLELLRLIDKAYDANITIEPSDEVRIDRSLDSTRFRKTANFEPESWPEMIRRMRDNAKIYDRFN